MLCHSHRSFRAIVKVVRPISKRNNIIYYTFSNEHIQRANLEFTDKNVFIHRLFPKRNVSAGADILHCQESWNSRHWTISANISKNHHLKQTNRFNPAYWTAERSEGCTIPKYTIRQYLLYRSPTTQLFIWMVVMWRAHLSESQCTALTVTLTFTILLPNSWFLG